MEVSTNGEGTDGRTDILLATINARYIHASVGLRYLLANLGEMRERARILEFEIKQKPLRSPRNCCATNPALSGWASTFGTRR